MSHLTRVMKSAGLLAAVTIFAVGCARSSKTQFSQNIENDAGKQAPTYEEWVSLVGQVKTDELYAGIGQDSLNLLVYGVGQSNMVQLINGITDGSRLITLVGNDQIAGNGPGAMTGLGSVVTLYLLKSVNTQMQANLSINLVGGGVAPTDQDTITNLVGVINGLSAAQIQTHLIELFGPSGFNLSRSLAVPSGGHTAAEQQLIVDRMARVVAHVDNTASACNKVCTLLTNLSAADVTNKLDEMLMFNLGSGMAFADKLVETIETTTTITNLVALISSTIVPPATIPGVTTANITAKMLPILDAVSDCTKMGYTINNVSSLDTLINIINNVQEPARMGQLINMTENGGTWAGQTSPAETWGSPVKAAPFGTAGAGATITGNVAAGTLTAVTVTAAGTNYLPGTTLTFPGCGTQPTVHMGVVGGGFTVGTSSVTGPHWVIAGGAGCTNGAAQPATVVAPTAPNTTGMPRLVGIINGISPAADYYKLLALIDSISDMNKMVRLVQDLTNVADIYDLLNNMTGVVGATCTVANGVDTGVTIVGGGGSLATATSFNVGNQVAYLRMTAGGSGYTSQPTITVPGCTGVSYTATIVGGVITQITANNNSINNMAQVVELMTLANLPRLQKVVDGQRIYDNVNESQQTNAALTTTYLGKLKVLMDNLSQPLEGTIKVSDLLNGVTLPDKIIDLIWGVTNTTNLSTVINGIFKSSEVPGCSDGTAKTYIGPTTGPHGLDTGTCENSGDGVFYGERDTAVTTLVYLVENTASSAKLISMIDNITPAKIIELINYTATYSQHADGTPHVYPRGGAGLDPQAAGKRLAKVVDNTASIANLNYVTNNVSSIIRMAKLVSFMDIGVAANDGTGKLAVLINAVTGTNCFLSTTVPGRGNVTAAPPGGSAACLAQNSTNATGMGKMVNVIEFLSGATVSNAMVQMKDLLNNITDINKMADLINQTVNSSNIVGLLNGVTDVRYGTSTTDLVTLMNNMPRGEIGKLVSLVGEIGNAQGTTTATFPGADHVLIAQLMSAYISGNITTTSGVGVSTMSTLMGVLGMTGGSGYTATGAITGLNAGGGTGAAATTVISTATGTVTGVTLTAEGSCSVAPTGATVGGGGSGATVTVVTAPEAGSATNSRVKAVYINNGGSGYSASTITFTGGTCAPSPSATTSVDGVIGAAVTAGGSNYTDSFTIATGDIPGGGSGATATALVAGTIDTLSSYYGGKGYTTGDVCPIRGAAGDGTATCTVTAAAGVLTGCSAIAGGNGYIDGQIVTIGGAASAFGTVDGAGNLTGMNVISGGCGYAIAPTVTVRTGANECATAGTYTAVLTGSTVTSITVGVQATGCPPSPTIVLGETPYAAHGDGASAIIDKITAATGKVVAISFSEGADYLAQLLTNTEKAPGLAAINYNNTAPNISAREAMVRMLLHGVRHTSAGYPGPGYVDLPGIGPVHVGNNVLNNLNAKSVMDVVNLLNSDTTSLTDPVGLIGCADHVEFAVVVPLAANDFESLCSSHTPTLW